MPVCSSRVAFFICRTHTFNMSQENDAAVAPAEVDDLTKSLDLTRFFGDDDEVCPICLEVMPLSTFRGTERTRSVCCGKLTCADCVKDLQGHQIKSVEKMRARAENPNTASDGHAMERARKQVDQSLACPNCRKKLPQSAKENFEMVKEHAENGHAWAQQSLG